VSTYTFRSVIRQAVGKTMRECYVGTAATGCTTATVICNDLIDTTESDSRYVGNWISWATSPFPAITRRVASYDPSTGALTLSRPVATAEIPIGASSGVIGTVFEIHSLLSPDDLNDCINKALLRCPYLAEETLLPVIGRRNYLLASTPALAALSYLRLPEQIVEVMIRTGTWPAYTYTPMRPFRVRQYTPQGLLLDVPAYVTGMSPTDTAFILKMILPTAPVTGDSDNMTVFSEWVEAGTEMFAWKLLAESGPASDTERFSKKQMQAAQRFWEWTRVYAPRDVCPVMSMRNI
jgi:hypothetical protein